MIQKTILEGTFENAKKNGFKGNENEFNDYKRILNEGVIFAQNAKKIDTFKLQTTKIINYILNYLFETKNNFQLFKAIFDYCVHNKVTIKNLKIYQDYILKKMEVKEDANSNTNTSQNTITNFWEYL